MRTVLAAALILVTAQAPGADYVEVRRDATVYAEPNKRSPKIAELSPAEQAGPLVLELVSTTRRNGYYQVRLTNQPAQGWIYKTYVRRPPGLEPKYVPYRRSLYRHWIDADGNCRDTRQEVLVRDATGGVQFRPPRDCVVVRGLWLDPYTGQSFREPRQLDIDHVVPLKNAHESGAWAWSKEKRQEYANYLADRWHLLAVQNSENRKKGEKGPDRYLPPDSSFHCDYIRIWSTIKRDWEIEMTEKEREAVQQVLVSCDQR